MSRRPSRRSIVAVMSLSLPAGLTVAGSSDATTSDSVVETSVATLSETAAAESWEPGEIDWTELRPGFDQGYLDVPLDYAHPDDGAVRLHMMRRLADGPAARVGSLVVNPGGPGFGASAFVDYIDAAVSPEVLEVFDVIGFDSRGTGLTEGAIDCVDDYDHFYSGTDITPDDDAERQQIIDLAEEFADACVANNATFIQFVGTNNAARDIDSIRRALGEDEISFFAHGYGELGGVWATMFPTTVRAAVIDSSPDPNANPIEVGIQQAEAFENALTTYLAECSAEPGCLFHNGGDAEGAFDELMLQLDETPIPSVEGRPDITRGVALTAVSYAMNNPAVWPRLSAALTAAQRGRGAALLQGYDSFFEYNGDGTWPDVFEAFQTIRCMDSDQRLTVEEDDAIAARLREVSPRLSPGTTGSYFCTFFPPSTDPRIDITGAGAGPILVCGVTGDSSTPLHGTRALAETLEDGYLIVVDAPGTGCWRDSECANDLITDYLIDLDLPADSETNCPPG